MFSVLQCVTISFIYTVMGVWEHTLRPRSLKTGNWLQPGLTWSQMHRKDDKLGFKGTSGFGLNVNLSLLHWYGCSLDSSSCTQTGNVSASNVIEFMTICSSAQQRPFVLRPQHGCRACLSPTNRRAVVSCSGWPLSDQIMWLRTQTGWEIDGFRLIRSIVAEGRKGTKHGINDFCTFLFLVPDCRVVVQDVVRVSTVCGGSFSPACREMCNIGM